MWRAARVVALCATLLAAVVSADEIFHKWASIGPSTTVTASATVNGTEQVVMGWRNTQEGRVTIALYNNEALRWLIKGDGSDIELFDLRYDAGRAVVWGVGKVTSDEVSITDTKGKTTTYKFPPLPSPDENGPAMYFFAASLNLAGVVQSIVGVTSKWSATSTIEPVASAEVTQEHTLVMAVPFYDVLVSSVSHKVTGVGLNSGVCMLRSAATSFELFIVLPQDDTAEVVITAVEPSAAEYKFFAAGHLLNTTSNEHVGFVMFITIGAMMSRVGWTKTISLTPAVQGFELSSIRSTPTTPEIAVLVGTFTGTIKTPLADTKCSKDPCVIVAAFKTDGTAQYQSVVEATGEAGPQSPLFIISNGTNVMVSGPATAATHIGTMQWMSAAKVVKPAVFLASFGASGLPYYLNPLYDGATSGSIWTMAARGSTVFVGGTIDAVNMSLPGSSYVVTTTELFGYIAYMSPFVYGSDDTTVPPEEIGYEWASPTTVIVVFVFAAVALGGTAFVLYRSRRAKRHGRSVGRNKRYTPITLDNDDLNDVSVFAIDDDSL